MSELEIQQGEGKWIRFTVTDKGAPVPLTSAECFFGVKADITDTGYVYSALYSEESKWDKTQLADGVVRVNMPASVTKALNVAVYIAACKFIFTADTDVDKSQQVNIKIVPAVLHDT